MAKLGRDEIVTIRVLQGQGESMRQVARRFGVSEGAVRYHVRREKEGASDGRKKTFLIEQHELEQVVAQWWADQVACLPRGRPPNVVILHERLANDHEYPGSYKSVLKYVRMKFPAPQIRPLRRVETPPGAQSQSDWAERWVDVGDPQGPTRLYAFVMILSHSRRCAIVWSRQANQLAWHHVHNEAYCRLEGVAAVNRIDNLKTGIATGAGPWGEVNAQYRTYARHMRFHVDACEPRQPQQKGKVERAVREIDRLSLSDRCFDGMENLQQWTDAKILASSRRRKCPATGKTIYESWLDEKPHLGPLPPSLPEPFDLVKTRQVHSDCTVRFEGRVYGVPFAHVGQFVEIRGCASQVQITDPDSSALLIAYERGTAERILVPPACYEGEATERVMPPRPLGKMARKLQEISAMPVETRPVDLYAALMEVAR